MNDALALSLLFIIIVGQIIERYFLLKRESKDKEALIDQISKLQAALMTRSAQEYVMTRSIDKVVKEETPKTDQLAADMTELTDEEYDKYIEVQNQ